MFGLTGSVKRRWWILDMNYQKHPSRWLPVRLTSVKSSSSFSTNEVHLQQRHTMPLVWFFLKKEKSFLASCMTILRILNIYSSNIGKFTGAVLTSSARQQQRADRKIRRVLFMAAVKEEKKLWVKIQIESGDIYVPLAQHNQILITAIF